jgi:hypothetical protein
MDRMDRIFTKIVNQAPTRSYDGEDSPYDGVHTVKSRRSLNLKAGLAAEEFCGGPYSKSTRDGHHSQATAVRNAWDEAHPHAHSGQLPAPGERAGLGRVGKGHVQFTF